MPQPQTHKPVRGVPLPPPPRAVATQFLTQLALVVCIIAVGLITLNAAPTDVQHYLGSVVKYISTYTQYINYP